MNDVKRGTLWQRLAKGDFTKLSERHYLQFPETINRELMKDEIILMQEQGVFLTADGIHKMGRIITPTQYMDKIKSGVSLTNDAAIGKGDEEAHRLAKDLIYLDTIPDSKALHEIAIAKRQLGEVSRIMSDKSKDNNKKFAEVKHYKDLYNNIIKAYDSGLDDEGWGGTVPGQSLSPQPGEDVPNVVDWIKGLFSDSSDATTTGVSGDNLFASAGIRDWSQVDDVWRGSAPQINTGDNNFSETISEWFEGNKTIPEDISNLASDAVSAVKDLTGNLVNPSTAISLALSAAQGGIKNVLSNPLSLIGNKVLASQGLLPTSLSTIAKLPGAIGSAIASPSTALGGTLGGAAGAAAVIGAPMALIGAGIASNRKARAQAEIEEKKNRTGSARYNFVPGELWMAGNKRTSPVLDEANTNFRYTDELTGMHIIYEQDPRRPVMGGDSLSKRGQDFAREAGIEYTNPDPDIQNTSQKWLGKQQVYSELIPELKPVFMAGLKGQMPRNQTEDMVAKVTNRYFQENPNISEIYRLNKKIEYLTEQNKSEGDSFVEGQITDLEFQREGLKENVPEGWKKVKAFKPMPVIISIEEEEQE